MNPADITFVRLARVDAFYSVLDTFSRKVFGWDIAPALFSDLIAAA